MLRLDEGADLAAYPQLGECIEAVRGGRPNRPIELHVEGPEGSGLWLELRGELVEGGEPGAVVVWLVDRSGREREATDRTRDLFLGALGHDLRSPLQTIRLGAEALRRAKLGPAVAQVVSPMLRAAKRMGRMLEQLLEFARLQVIDADGGSPVIPKLDVDLAAIVGEIVTEVRAAYPERMIEYGFGGEVCGYWDRDRLAQVVSNLLCNAVTHGDDPVRVTVVCEGEYAVLEVCNRGAPIPAAALEGLFQPFRLSASDGDAGSSAGTGSGCSSSARLCRPTPAPWRSARRPRLARGSASACPCVGPRPRVGSRSGSRSIGQGKLDAQGVVIGAAAREDLDGADLQAAQVDVREASPRQGRERRLEPVAPGKVADHSTPTRAPGVEVARDQQRPEVASDRLADLPELGLEGRRSAEIDAVEVDEQQGRVVVFELDPSQQRGFWRAGEGLADRRQQGALADRLGGGPGCDAARPALAAEFEGDDQGPRALSGLQGPKRGLLGRLLQQEQLDAGREAQELVLEAGATLLVDVPAEQLELGRELGGAGLAGREGRGLEAGVDAAEPQSNDGRNEAHPRRSGQASTSEGVHARDG